MKGKLSIRARGNTLLETLCLEYLLIMGVLRGYVEYNRIWQTILMILFILLLISKRRYMTELIDLILKNIPFWFAVIFGGISVIVGISNQYLISNFLKWIEGLIFLCMLDLLSSNENFHLRVVLKSKFYFLNFFWLANLVITSIQCSGIRLFIKAEWLAANPFYPDQCAGLFGFSGTIRLCLFSVFMMLYNLWVAEEMVNRLRKKILYAFTFITVLWMLFLSTFNDNKTLFVLIPVFFILFYIIRVSEKRIMLKNMVRKAVMSLRFIILAVIVVVVFQKIVPNVASFIQEYVVQSMLRLATQGRIGNHGSIERLTIGIDAIKGGYGLLFGDGLGAAILSERLGASYRGYKHFSMSSFGSLITLGGLWFYISCCLFHAKAFSRMLNQKTTSPLSLFLCLGIIIGLTIYMPLFEIELNYLLICFIFLVLGRDKELKECKVKNCI